MAYAKVAQALFTFAGGISVERKASAGEIFRRAHSQSAMGKEKGLPDERLAAGRKLTENVNKAVAQAMRQLDKLPVFSVP